MTIFFTYLDTPTSPVSYYAHSILLCCPSLVSARLCVALLMPTLTNLHLSSSHQPPRHTATPPPDAAKTYSLNLWQPCSTLMTLLAVWDGFFLPFFRGLMNSRQRLN